MDKALRTAWLDHGTPPGSTTSEYPERNFSFGAPSRSYSDPSLYITPPQPLGPELNSDDSNTESWYLHLQSLFNVVRNYIADTLSTLVTQFCGGINIRPVTIHLASSVVNFITTCYATSLSGKSFALKALMTASLVTSFTSFITSVGQIVLESKYSWMADAAMYCAKSCVNTMVDTIIKETSNLPKTFTNFFTATSNELKPESWIKIGIASITAVLFAGLGLTKSVDWRELIQKADVLDRGRKTATTLNEIANFIVHEVAGIESDSDYVAIQEIMELVEAGDRLTKLTPAHFIQHPDDFVTLQKFTERIVKVTSKSVAKDTSNRYHTARQLLVSMYKILHEKQVAITAILETRNRQATFGVLFSGMKGVGKSEFAKYLSDMVADIMGYNRGVYVLNKKDQGFYEPYGGQAFGLYNEWMAMRSEDPLLKDFNLICSSDPVNFEGASLECKTQPNRLKLLFLTANVENPDLTYVLNEGAADATWDRIYHVKMVDPKCRGRKAPNPHRKPDFSHITFNRIDHNGSVITDGPRLTVKEILNRIVGRVSEREEDYLRQTIKQGVDEQTRLLLGQRLTVLQNLKRENPAYDADLLATANSGGREFFCARFQGQSGYGKTQMAQYCAIELASIFKMEWQKSRTADEFVPNPDKPLVYLLDDWAEKGVHQDILEKMNITHELSIFLFTSNTVVGRCARSYTPSALLNRAYAYYMNAADLPPFDGSIFDMTPGMIRRIGLQGVIRAANGDNILVDENITSTFTFTNQFVCRDIYNQIGSRKDVLSVLFRKYRNYASRPADILLLEDTPSVYSEPGVRIVAKNITELVSTLKDIKKIVSAVIGTNSSVQLYRSPQLQQTVSGQTSGEMWLIPYDLSPKTDDELKEMFIQFCTRYRKVTLHSPLHIHLKEENKHFYYHNNVAYVYGDQSIADETPISFDNHSFTYYRSASEQFKVSLECYLSYKQYGVYTGPYLQFELSEIIAIDRRIGEILANDDDVSLFKVNYYRTQNNNELASKGIYKVLVNKFKAHPIFWLGCGLLVIAASGYGLYMLSQLLFQKEESQPDYDDDAEALNPWEHRRDKAYRDSFLLPWEANTAEDPRKRFHPKFKANTAEDPRKRMHPKFKANDQKEYVPDLVIKPMTKEVRKANQLVDQAAIQLRPDKPFDRSKFITEIADFMACKSNSDDPHLSVTTSDQLNSLLASASLARHCYDPPSADASEFSKFVYSNMLSFDDMIKQEYTSVEQIQKTITKLYYKIINSRGGSCYGIGLFGKYILTVSHMFDEAFEPCIVQSNGEQYNAQCVYIARDRDLAVLRVQDKTFPNIPNTARHFHTQEDLESQVYGFFIRGGPSCEVMGGYLSYHSTTAYPITDAQNKNFRLSQRVIAFSSIGGHKMRDFVKRGDCGFPIVAPKAGTYKILGLHNSYAEMEKMHFSSFTSKDHHDFLESAIRATPNNSDLDLEMKVVKVEPVGETFMLPMPYVQALTSLYDDYRFTNHKDKLMLLGFTPDLALRSRPKLKIHYMDFEGMTTPTYTLPAAFTDEYVSDFSELAKDTYGDPDPLFTQCLKYDRTVENNFDMDIFKEAMDRTVEDIYARYGDCRFLRGHEVINGKHMEALSAFNPTTSAGPLLKMAFGITNKLPIFDAAPNQNQRVLIYSKSPAASMVREHYNAYVRSLLNGGPPPLIVSKDCAKVELINAEKAQKGKVRLFNEIDLSINMVLKKFFGDLQNKVMENHIDNPIKMGQNPYRCSTSIWKQFAEIQGQPISTDFSAFDKQLSPYLIMTFCRAAAVCYADASPEHTREDIERLYEKLSMTLTFVVHTVRGSIYMVDRGNESGTFVTTLLNSVSVRCLTLYTIVRKWRTIFRFTPTLADLNNHYREAIYGDDRTVKISQVLEVTEQDFVADSKLFGLKCTPAKTQSGIDFCSRAFYWDEKRQVCFPALKTESVLSLVRWFKSLERQQVIDNIDCCLFEAAIHPQPEIFDQALADIKIICSNLHIPLHQLHFFSRDVIRARFVAYVRETEEYEWLTYHSDNEDSLSQRAFFDTVVEYRRTLSAKSKRLTENIENCPDSIKRSQRILKKYMQGPRTAVMADPKTNPISYVLEALAACKISEKPTEVVTDEPDGRFKYQLTLLGEKSEASGLSKREAKKLAYAELINKLAPKIEERIRENRPTALQANASAKKAAERYMYGSINNHLQRAYFVAQQIGRPVIVLSKHLPAHLKWQSISDKEEGCIRYSLDELTGSAYVLSATTQSFPYSDMHPIYAMQPGTRDHGEKVTVGDSVTISNSAPPPAGNAGPSLVGDAMTNPGITTIPSLENPVSITQSMPAVQDNAPPAMGAFEPMMPQMNLNPAGPPNMLSAGAIGFDLKDLCYSQIIDCDEMFTFTDDTPEGSILFQIPYDPQSKFVNKFIKQYVNLHGRYAGDLKFRVNVVGNQTFSGFLAMCWQPKKFAGTVMPISDAMKYNYLGESINQPFGACFTLGDARQDQFFRYTSDVDDVDSRPHLICFVLMAPQSPFKQGIKVRIRVGSILTRSFQVADPLVASTPAPDPSAYGLYQNSISRLVGQSLMPVVARPYFEGTSLFHIVMDGNTYSERTTSYLSDYCVSKYTYYAEADLQATSIQCAYHVTSGYTAIDTSPWFMIGRNPLWVWFDMTRLPDFWNNTLKNQVQNTLDKFVAGTEDKLTPAACWDAIYKDSNAVGYIMYNILGKADFQFPAGGGNLHLNFEQDKMVGGIFIYHNGYVEMFVGNSKTQPPDTEKLPIELNLRDNSFAQVTQVHSVAYKEGAEAMPAGYRHVAITPDLPFVAVEGMVTSYMQNHPSIFAFLTSLEIKLEPNQVIQIELADFESARTVTTLRYLPDRQSLVMNVGDDPLMFATSLRPAERMYIVQISIIERTNSFPITDLVGNFVDNQLHPDVVARKFRRAMRDIPYDPTPYGKVTANGAGAAMGIAGGVIGGIGQGMADAARRDWESSERKDQNRWQGQENEKGREWQTGEREASQGWQSGENSKDRDWRTGERQDQNRWQTGEREAGQNWQTSEREGRQDWQTGEREAGQSWQTGEREGHESWQSGENEANRGWTSEENEKNRAHEGWENELDRQWNEWNERSKREQQTSEREASQGWQSGENQANRDFQGSMQGNMFEQQTKMQQAKFKQEKEMAYLNAQLRGYATPGAGYGLNAAGASVNVNNYGWQPQGSYPTSDGSVHRAAAGLGSMPHARPQMSTSTGVQAGPSSRSFGTQTAPASTGRKSGMTTTGKTLHPNRQTISPQSSGIKPSTNFTGGIPTGGARPPSISVR